MKRSWTLQPDEERKEQVEGQYLVVTRTAGPVELVIGGSTPIEVDINDRVHLNAISPNDRSIKIRNLSGGVNEFEIHTSDLLVDKRTAADLANALITIAPGERVGIDPAQNIVQSIIQNAITVATGQLIGIDATANDVDATIQNAISIAASQVIGIDSTANTVNVALPDRQYNDLTSQTITAGTASIAANTNREELLLTADTANTATIWLGGTSGQGESLAAGEKVRLSINQALTLTGTNGDQVHVAEIERV